MCPTPLSTLKLYPASPYKYSRSSVQTRIATIQPMIRVRTPPRVVRSLYVAFVCAEEQGVSKSCVVEAGGTHLLESVERDEGRRLRENGTEVRRR